MGLVMTDDSRSYPRQAGGRFASGPGNPGRIPGTRNAVSRKAIAEIHNLSDAALTALKEAVGKGDMRAVTYVLDRLLPAGRTIQIDATTDGVRDAIENGDLSVTELREVATALNSLKALSELEQLRAEMNDLRKLLRG